jgi:hypothetical protein
MTTDSEFWEATKRKLVFEALESEMKATIDVDPDCKIEEIVSDTVSYYGRSFGSANYDAETWQIVRKITNAGVVKYESAGDGGFKYKWNDRATLFDSPGALTPAAKVLQSFPTQFDNVVISYVGTTSKISTAVYKLGSTTIKTATMSYDGSDRMTGVVWS